MMHIDDVGNNNQTALYNIVKYMVASNEARFRFIAWLMMVSLFTYLFIEKIFVCNAQLMQENTAEAL